MEETVPNSDNKNGNKLVGFKKEYIFAVVGFIIGGLLASGLTYSLTQSKNANLSTRSTNDNSSVTETNSEEIIDDSLNEVEEQQSNLDEGLIQEQEVDKKITEENITLPNYASNNFNNEFKTGNSSIVIERIERGVTFNADTEDERFTDDYLRVYFTIKNIGDENVLYGYNDFTLEDESGEVIQSDVDNGIGEFGWATLVPGASKKAFTLFRTNTQSGNIVWSPIEGADHKTPVKISFFKE